MPRRYILSEVEPVPNVPRGERHVVGRHYVIAFPARHDDDARAIGAAHVAGYPAGRGTTWRLVHAPTRAAHRLVTYLVHPDDAP